MSTRRASRRGAVASMVQPPSLTVVNSFVQKSTGSAYSGSLVLTPGWTTTPGNSLLVIFAIQGGTSTACSSPACPSMSAAFSREPASFSFEGTFVGYGDVTAAATTVTITLHPTGQTRNWVARIYELSGLRSGLTMISPNTMSSQVASSTPAMPNLSGAYGDLAVSTYNVTGNSTTEDITPSSTMNTLGGTTWQTDKDHNNNLFGGSYGSLNMFTGFSISPTPQTLGMSLSLAASRSYVGTSVLLG
ncbi:MAG TPA: hypothetical protein VHB51_00620 [Candidatus Saccharimonadales bacterium]|nr:hypothetical protein [Candidatus Saccharimonadales bacterium]